MPLITNGAPPAWNLMRPVSSHRKQITDFCSWNGLLVLSGIKPDARMMVTFSEIRSWAWDSGLEVSTTFGSSETKVKAAVPFDPLYLVTGYDRKSVQISHSASQSVTISLEIDIDGNGLWVKYKSFDVPVSATTQHEFPTSFSACWVHAVSNTDTSATIQFDYR